MWSTGKDQSFPLAMLPRLRDALRDAFPGDDTRTTSAGLPMTFSMIFPQASDRYSSVGNPSRVTVSI
jgi:hypothetical protein